MSKTKVQRRMSKWKNACSKAQKQYWKANESYVKTSYIGRGTENLTRYEYLMEFQWVSRDYAHRLKERLIKCDDLYNKYRVKAKEIPF